MEGSATNGANLYIFDNWYRTVDIYFINIHQVYGTFENINVKHK